MVYEVLDMGFDYILRPTIADVVMWVFEKYGIWIFCDITTTWYWTIQKSTGDYFHCRQGHEILNSLTDE